mmetsp:Transcript_56324/g.115192  ORF Transcript_56324/g.115192 Transcript_56324/m.115192 type:complete len:156 (+) Transcript_56324:1-468(+)
MRFNMGAGSLLLSLVLVGATAVSAFVPQGTPILALRRDSVAAASERCEHEPASTIAMMATNGVRRAGTAMSLFGFGKKEEDSTPAPPPAAKGGNCVKCKNVGAIDCPVCKGTGTDKKGGNVFERWKCMQCQGFGSIPCPACSASSGLTPEQTGER